MAGANLNQMLDKVAYGVGGVLALVILGLAFWLGSDVTETSAKAEGERANLQRKMAEQENQFPKVPDATTGQIVREQWNAGTASGADPRWVTERAPVLLRVFQKKPPVEAQHKPPVLAGLRCERDVEAKKPYVLVTGAASPENENVVLKEFQLWRKEEGGSEDFQKVSAAAIKPGAGDPGAFEYGAFEYRDLGVQAGKSYSYKLASVAERSPAAADNIKPPAQAVETSEPLGPTPPMPYDFSLRVFDVKLEAGAPARFIGSLKYWDYKQGKILNPRPPGGFAEGEKFGDGRYEFFPLDATNKEVTVRNLQVPGQSLVIKRSDKERPVAAWPPVTSAPPPAEDAEAAAQAGADAPKPARAGAEPPKPAATGRTAGKAPPKAEKPGTKTEKPGDKPAEKPPAKKPEKRPRFR